MTSLRPHIARWNAFSSHVRNQIHVGCIYSKFSRTLSSQPPPFPITQTCPEPTCNCAPTPPTPPTPEGLPIEREHPLNATMAAYSQQVLISTGQSDWTSRIEQDGVNKSWGSLVRGLKGLLGRGGKYADVCDGSIRGDD